MADGEEFWHEPVMGTEVLNYLALRSGGTYVDGTVGGGGHAALIAKAIGASGTLVAVDRDPAALAAARERLAFFKGRLILRKADFRELPNIWREEGLPPLDGLLLDLGVSSPQLDRPERGFSYRADGPLDMRLDPEGRVTAADLLNNLAERDLADIFRRFGEERFADRIAHFVVRARAKKPLQRTLELVEVVKSAIPAPARRTGGHPARRTFQALRMAVNDELGALEGLLMATPQLLAVGGRLVVISFHSLEDRIVKRFLSQAGSSMLPVMRSLTRRPVIPSEKERLRNPRARSAKLRAAERMGSDTEEAGIR